MARMKSTGEIAVTGRFELLAGLVLIPVSAFNHSEFKPGNVLLLAVVFTTILLVKRIPPLAVLPLLIVYVLWLAGIADHSLLSGFMVYLAVEVAVARGRPVIAGIIAVEWLIFAYFITLGTTLAEIRNAFPLADLMVSGSMELLFFIAAAAVGYLRFRTHRHQQHAQFELQQDLQASIAHYLHDSLARTLTVMAMQAELARLEVDDPDTRRKLDGISESGRSALEDLRQLVGHLMEPQPEAAESSLGSWNTATVGASIAAAGKMLEDAGYQLSCDVVDTGRRLNRDVETAFALAFNEVTANLVKHAPPGGAVDIQVGERDGTLAVSVTNTRAREPGHNNLPGGGLGMNSITARMHTVGGNATFNSTATDWNVVLTMPVADT